MSIQTQSGQFQVYKIAASKFQQRTIGTRVNLPVTQFVQEFVSSGVRAFEEKLAAPGDLAKRGQYFIGLDLEGVQTDVIFDSGVGLRSTDPADYFPAVWRDTVQLFGKRSLALPATGAAVIVYTAEAFLNDPEVTEEDRKWLEPGTRYVLVDVLAFSDSPKPPLTPERFVSNLGGGNDAYTPKALSDVVLNNLGSTGWNRARALLVGLDQENAKLQSMYHGGAYDAALHFATEALLIHRYWTKYVVVGDEP